MSKSNVVMFLLLSSATLTTMPTLTYESNE
jgi:hypothetical protein